jgi:hypothetical protein
VPLVDQNLSFLVTFLSVVILGMTYECRLSCQEIYPMNCYMEELGSYGRVCL